ncbi:MAG: hypothetical protein ACF8LL_03510, partial [Phycisphaerales bacterium]
MARVRRVYADTSVYGGVFDPEFEAHSSAFFEQVHRGRFGLVSSALVEDELAEAPERVRAYYASLGALLELAEVTAETADLQNAYLDAGILSERSAEDALHVALATIARCDLLVSWNYRHIVHI